MVKRNIEKIIIFSIVSLFFGIGILPNIYAHNIEINNDQIYAFELKNNNIIGPPRESEWWSMYHHDQYNSGFSPSNAPDNDDVLWSFQNGHIVTSSAAIARGKVYIGDWYNNFYCFNMSSGQLIWNFTTEGEITSSPAVYSNRVYFGSRDLKVYCLDADTGDYIWDFKTKGAVESSPVIVDDKLFFGSNDGKLYCLNSNNGDVIWNFTHGNVIWSSPALWEDRLFFGTLDGVFYCISSLNGEEIWTYTTTSGIWTSASVMDGKVVFGSNDKNIYCLDVENGNVIWSYDVASEIHSSPAIAYGNVYFGAQDGNLYCINFETGDVVWTYLINGEITSSPTVADDKVYFGTNICCGNPNYFICIDAHNGNLIWNYHIGSWEMKSAPAISAGRVVFGSHNGNIICFGTDDLIADANGPYFGHLGDSLQFYGDAYGGSPEYSWYWDFGDNETSIEKNPVHNYDELGSYTVTLSVTDNDGTISVDTTYAYISEPNVPPERPIITGEANGNFGESYNYTFMSTDPNSDEIFYYIDWDDDTYEEWIGPYESGEEVIISHSWNTQGTYIISCKAKDINDAESDWATLEVVMPVNKQIINSLLQMILERFPNAFPILRILFEM